MNIRFNAAHPLVTFFNENFLSSLTGTQKKVLAVAAIVFGILAVCLTAYRCSCWRRLLEKVAPKQKVSPKEDDRLQPSWINDHPNTSLVDLGLRDLDAIFNYVKKNGKDLRCLNLEGLTDIDDAQFEQIVNCCPDLNDLSISSDNITDAALAHLKGKPLTAVCFNWCTNLTDNALVHLKGMQLDYVGFRGCSELTEAGLVHFKGMPLTSFSFEGCPKISDKARAQLIS